MISATAKPILKTSFLVALSGLPVLGLLSYLYLGWMARWLADDYCTLRTLTDTGFWGSQSWWYVHWSGRITATFFTTILELLGPQVVPVVPGATILVLLGESTAVFVLLKRQFARAWSFSSIWLASTVLIFSFIALIPNLLQSYSWQTGLVTYLWPVVGLLGWILNYYLWSADFFTNTRLLAS